MNVLIIDTECMNLDMAMRCAAAGHSVKWFKWMAPRKPVRDGEGFKGFQIVPDWRPHMPWARDGLIVVTGNHVSLNELDRYREMGYRIFGPTAASARLEIERSAGMDLIKSIGHEIPPFQTFGSLEDAEGFARKSDRAWVHKPCGDEPDKSLTYVSRDQADMCGWLRRQIKSGKKLKGSCMLQEKIEKMGEVGVSGWMGPEGFLPGKWNVCHEFKPLFPGDVGPNTGEQGTVMVYSETDKLAEEFLMPLEPALRALGHTGDFAVGAMIGKDGKPQFLEFTARLGYPAWYIQCASHRGDPAKWMRDLLDGKDSLRVSNDVAIGVVLAQPRYPYNISLPEHVEGNPIHGIEDVLKDVHMIAVMMGKGPVLDGDKVVDRPIFETTGEYVAVATSQGKTVQKAQKKVYSIVDKISYSDKMFRNDIGNRLEGELPKLHSAGYAKDIVW